MDINKATQTDANQPRSNIATAPARPALVRANQCCDERPTVAANDDRLDPTSEQGSVAEMKSLLQRFECVCEAPAGLPNLALAMRGLAHVVKVACAQGHLPGHCLDAIQSLEALALSQDRGDAAMQALARRKSIHPSYALLIEVGTIAAEDKQRALQLCPVAASILALKVTKSILVGKPIADVRGLMRLRSALVSPGASAARSWTPTSRAKSRDRASEVLLAALAKHTESARALGWDLPNDSDEAERRSTHPVEHFNDLLRRRTNAIRNSATDEAIAGGGGAGFVPAAELPSIGRLIVAGVECDDPNAAYFAIAVISNLPFSTCAHIPCCWGGEVDGALAWLDTRAGVLFRCQFELTDSGADPEPGTEHLYTPTSRIVPVPLPPFLHARLARAWKKDSGTTTSLSALIGDCLINAYYSPVNNGQVRPATFARIARSVPVHLLEAGHGRYAVALATGAPYLIARRRESYGAIAAIDVRRAVKARDRLFGWSSGPWPTSPAYFGSRIEPTGAAVQQVFASLAGTADCATARMEDTEGLVEAFNCVGAWTSCAAGLALLLRKSGSYTLRLDELLNGTETVLADKAVHFDGDQPVPVVPWLQELVAKWRHFALAMADELERRGEVELATHIRERIAEGVGPNLEFKGKVLVLGGHALWLDRLPPSLKVQPNFGRQFWP